MVASSEITKVRIFLIIQLTLIYCLFEPTTERMIRWTMGIRAMRRVGKWKVRILRMTIMVRVPVSHTEPKPQTRQMMKTPLDVSICTGDPCVMSSCTDVLT